MKPTILLSVALAVLLAGCDPKARCVSAIEATQSEINAAREKESDFDRINEIVGAGQILSNAEHRRATGDYEACMAEVARAKAELERVLQGS